MSKAMLAIGILLIGLSGFWMLNVVTSYTSGNELDFYLLRDTTEAAMLDAVDTSFYQATGELRMDREKFVQSFVLRFANSVDPSRHYDIKFYDLNETPPKVSVMVDSSTTATFNSENLGIKNQIDAILETKYDEKRTVDEAIDDSLHS